LGLKHSFGQKASMDTWFSGARQRITAVDEAALLRLYPEAESLVFSVGSLRDAVIDAAYPGHSFCDPEPAPGLFCGGPLPANPATRNPMGGTPHYTFSINGVGLPFGLTLNFNGVLTGTPAAGTPTGLQQFQVCATDQVGVKVCRQAEIYVIAPTPTPTPRPTATPAPTATPVPPPPTATPVPEPGSVLIQAADCTFASRIEYPNGVDEEFDVTITVTIKGPLGTTFRVSRVHTATSQLWFSEYSSSWTGEFNTGRRDQGQPETNTWSETLRVHTFNEPGQQQSGTILFTATVTDSYGSKETTQTVTCPWQ
ncbi:MAG: putative Ig domain-containing protein, partial [Chloroflexi bacterium]|nr:putative Ig domain-containing protein [Chloroflexota bacterium]